MSSTRDVDRLRAQRSGAARLAGATAVVTGASRGIGLAIARALVDEGARVALVARNEATLTDTARTLGPTATPVVCDVANAAAVADTAARIRRTLGGAPDVLVNNAGAFTLAPVDRIEEAAFQATLDTNLVAPFLFARAFLPEMRARGAGDIVTIGSIADRVVFPGNGAYAASKHGLRALHEVMRLELRGSGVRATLVSPGPVDTSLWDAVGPDNREGFTPRAEMLSASAVAAAVIYSIVQPRDVNVDELRLSHS
jgi:NADP-dependent 3-hydroxy acid dehydrogenase YdfG